MEKQIITKFLAEYEITNDKDDYVTQLELSNWSDKNGYRVSKFLKYLQEHCVNNNFLNMKCKSYKYEKICTGIKKKAVQLKESEPESEPSEQEPEPQLEPKPEPKQEKISELDEQYARFTSYTYNPDTLDVFFNSKPVCWISFDPEEEFIILQENNSKELLLKDTLRDYIVNED